KRGDNRNALVSLYQADLRIQQVDGLAALTNDAALFELLVYQLLVGIVRGERDQGLPVQRCPAGRDAVERSILIRADHHQGKAKKGCPPYTRHPLENS